MAWLATVLFAGGAWLLWRLARRLRDQPRGLMWVATGTLVFLLGWLYLTGFSDLGAGIPWDDFVFFERLPAHLSTLFLLGLCWYVPSRVRRNLIAVLLVIAGGYGVLEVTGPLLMPVYAGGLSTATGPEGRLRQVEVIQSTGWTCGPAALAWALQLRGHPVSEKQAASLTVTTPFHGTPDRGVIRAAHRLGLQARLARHLTYEQLVDLPHPCLITWHLGGMVMHLVVVIEADAQGVKVGDPMLGEVDYTQAEFVKRWQKNAVVFE